MNYANYCEFLIAVLLFICFLMVIPWQNTFSTSESKRSLNHIPNLTNKGNLITNQVSGIIHDVFGRDSSNKKDIQEIVKKCTSCECSRIKMDMRIVGGQNAVNRYPWMARIIYDGNFHCGASLLTENYVLTAAHCILLHKRSKIRIILGDKTVGRPKKHTVAEIVCHRSYDPLNDNHDIALLKLQKSVKFTREITPICLPSATNDPAGRDGVVMGWGLTTESGNQSKVLKEVEVRILTLAECRATKYGESRITKYMLCASSEGKDSCKGDSGGPLTVTNGAKYEIVGIVSFGEGCARPGFPGVYTRVAMHMTWLTSKLKNSCICT